MGRLTLKVKISSICCSLVFGDPRPRPQNSKMTLNTLEDGQRPQNNWNDPNSNICSEVNIYLLGCEHCSVGEQWGSNTTEIY